MVVDHNMLWLCDVVALFVVYIRGGLGLGSGGSSEWGQGDQGRRAQNSVAWA